MGGGLDIHELEEDESHHHEGEDREDGGTRVTDLINSDIDPWTRQSGDLPEESDESEEFRTSVLWNHLREEGASDALAATQQESGTEADQQPLDTDLKSKWSPNPVPDGDRDGIQHTVSEVGGMVDARVGSHERTIGDGERESRLFDVPDEL